MDTIRTFVAIDIPQNIKMELDKLVTTLRPFGPDIKWVKAANLHVTLRFLGDITRDSIAGLAQEMDSKIKGFGKFQLALSGIGGFPNLNRPRVIWVGSSEGTERLMTLASLAEQACIDSGFGKSDKPFSSHMTIGRVKFAKGLDKLITKIESTKFASVPFDIEDVIIFQSDLSPSGPKYTRLETIKI